jgi:hypothetical protein
MVDNSNERTRPRRRVAKHVLGIDFTPLALALCFVAFLTFLAFLCWFTKSVDPLYGLLILLMFV